MFAQEILLQGEIQLVHFSLIVIATTTSVVASRATLGADIVFHVRNFVLASYWELLTYALMGLILGVVAVGYTRLFHVVLERAGRLRLGTATKLIGGLALVGVLGIALPQNPNRILQRGESLVLACPDAAVRRLERTRGGFTERLLGRERASKARYSTTQVSRRLNGASRSSARAGAWHD